MPRIASIADLATRINHIAGLERSERATIPELDFGDILSPPIPEVLERRRVVRPDDLFVGDFLFGNLSLTPRPPHRLIRTVPSRNAFLGLELQGQHFGEEALTANASGSTPFDLLNPERNVPPPSPRTMRARLAYPSRLVVRMPETVMGIDYAFDAFLDALTNWPLSLDPLARTFLPDFGLADQLREFAVAIQPAKVEFRKILAENGVEEVARKAVRDAERVALTRRTEDAVSAREAIARSVGAAGRAGEELRAAATALFELRLAEVTAERIVATPAGEQPIFEEIAGISGLLFLFLVPHRPGAFVTSLELPYRLLQSPHSGAAFAHETAPVTLSNRTELWRTTMRQRTQGSTAPIPPNGLPITVMWSPNYRGTSGPPVKDPFRMSLAPHHRDELVRLMSGHNEKLANSTRSYRPTPARAHRMQLSAWGGVLEANGEWLVDVAGVGVEEWQQDISFGRDERVRVVEGGFLYPFGHRAALLTLTQREVEDANPSGCGAFLRQRKFIIVREPEKTFPGPGMAFAGRKLPFRRILCLTSKTPELLPETHPASDTGIRAGLGKPAAFWPILVGDTDPFFFEFEAEDLAGRIVNFKSRVLFLPKTLAFQPAAMMPAIKAEWSGPGTTINPRSEVAFGGQVVRLAEVGGGKPGDVDVPLEKVVFEATAAPGQLPPFHPAIRCADARLKALEGVTGMTATETVEYEPGKYLPQGYAGNPWRVFLQLKTPKQIRMGPDVPTDKVGGIGQPTQTLSAITNGSGAVSGPVSSLTDGGAMSGGISPGDMFPDAKILGGFDLKDLMAPFLATAIGQIPGFKTEEFPDKIVTSWAYKNEDLPNGIPGLVLNAGTGPSGKSVLELGAKLTAYTVLDDPDVGFKDKDGTPQPDFGATNDPGFKDPEVEATGKLTNFKLDFFGFIIVWFDEFSFKSTLKKKFDPNPKLHDTDAVVFGGPLEFVNTLSEIIPSGGFSDPPIIKPSLTDLQVGYDFKLPNVEVGVFALKNMKIGAILTIPFKGDPVALKFFFNTREAPFLLTVSMFGGGGFFALVTTAKGVQEIEAAFEFGAFASFDVGVASGGVYVKGGVYFHWKTDAVTLEGYVEMGGELSVLGLISVSVTFHLSLGYYKESGMSYVKGQATLTIEVEVLFFSASVKLKVERKFSGSSSDPTFAQLITDQGVWTEYCEAFG